MRRSEAKDAVMVREDYQHRIKFGSFKSRYIAVQVRCLLGINIYVLILSQSIHASLLHPSPNGDSNDYG